MREYRTTTHYSLIKHFPDVVVDVQVLSRINIIFIFPPKRISKPKKTTLKLHGPMHLYASKTKKTIFT